MAIAFFDLDKTLIARNSATLWIRFEWDAGNATVRQAAWALTWVVRYGLGIGDLTKPIRETVALIGGQPEAAMLPRVEDFHRRFVRPIYRADGRAAVEHHRSAGDRLVLLTSASNYLSELVCTDLGLDAYLANRFEVDADGLYTGRTIEPLCYGPGKVELARRFAAEHGDSLDEATFYSDSASDLPMLEAVGKPVAVTPDPRLRRAARRGGWPIVEWR